MRFSQPLENIYPGDHDQHAHLAPGMHRTFFKVDVLLLRRVSQTPRLQRLPPMIDGCTVGIEQDVVVVAVRVHADAREIE